MNDRETRWQRKDAWLGLLLLTAGVLITLYAYLAMRNDAPWPLWLEGWLVGPVLLLLGGNAVYRALRSSPRRRVS